MIHCYIFWLQHQLDQLPNLQTHLIFLPQCCSSICFLFSTYCCWAVIIERAFVSKRFGVCMCKYSLMYPLLPLVPSGHAGSGQKTSHFSLESSDSKYSCGILLPDFVYFDEFLLFLNCN